jgi:2-polyprenyl-3-methyl-5-hydroxy-6-metoxy-1,4-benzoquinol methylase
MSQQNYSLGHSDGEIRRLELQGGLLAPTTERVLCLAGVKTGMRVLDIGTGAGDVAMIAAKLVGPSGTVLGIDRAPSILEHARNRADAKGLAQIEYQAADLADFHHPELFDAVISRNTIGHNRDRVDFLRRSMAFARPKGIIAVMEVALPEPDLPQIKTGHRWSDPPVSLYDEVMDFCMAAFVLAGGRPATGSHLVRLFHEAQLSEPILIRDEPTCGPNSPMPEIACLMLGSLMAILEKHGLTTEAAIKPHTLLGRMQTAVAEAHSQLRQANIVGAWTTLT